MSECRSLTNIVGNAVATIVVARWEGALDMDRLQDALSGRLPPPEALALDNAASDHDEMPAEGVHGFH